jgi:hypothetical protein
MKTSSSRVITWMKRDKESFRSLWAGSLLEPVRRRQVPLLSARAALRSNGTGYKER